MKWIYGNKEISGTCQTDIKRRMLDKSIKALIFKKKNSHFISDNHINNRMLSFVIHAGYVGGEIAEKIHNPRYVHFFLQ